MDVKGNLNLVTYCNSRTEDIINLLDACDVIGNDSTDIHEGLEKRHEKRRTTSHFRYQVSRRKRSDKTTYHGKDLKRKSKICRQQKIPYPRYREQIRRTAYSNDHDNDSSIRAVSTINHRGRLGTHRYTCKRMRILKQWGYHIPFRNSSKACSALKDALRNHCVISDQSYYIPVYITGEKSRMIEFLGNFLSEAGCAFFDDETFTSGKFEEVVLLYAHNSFPFGLYGPAKMSFETWHGDGGNQSKLCIWLHRAMRTTF